MTLTEPDIDLSELLRIYALSELTKHVIAAPIFLSVAAAIQSKHDAMVLLAQEDAAQAGVPSRLERQVILLGKAVYFLTQTSFIIMSNKGRLPASGPPQEFKRTRFCTEEKIKREHLISSFA